MKELIRPSGPLKGEIEVPGDKSISHRALMFGAIASGVTEISNFLRGEDCLSTARCLRMLGVRIEESCDGNVIVYGAGPGGLKEPVGILDAGNSGTTLRLISGILAGQNFYSVLTGDASILQRPMGRVVEPLKEMGATIWGREGGRFAPLAIQGGSLKGIDYMLPVASAQVKSALLLAGLFAKGKTRVTEPAPSRDHSERMLSYFGVSLKIDGNTVEVEGRSNLTGRPVQVPGDISSAAFFLVAAAIIPGSNLVIKGVGINPTRDGVIRVLEAMGAEITVSNKREQSGEPVGDITVKGRTAPLKATEIGGDLIPLLIDEIPVLAVAAVFAQGRTVISGARELRVKESDRIATMCAELRKMGASVEEKPDGMIIEGPGKLRGATVESHEDHRVAMSLAVAALAAEGETVIDGAASVNISFPEFFPLLKRISGLS